MSGGYEKKGDFGHLFCFYDANLYSNHFHTDKTNLPEVLDTQNECMKKIEK